MTWASSQCPSLSTDIGPEISTICKIVSCVLDLGPFPSASHLIIPEEGRHASQSVDKCSQENALCHGIPLTRETGWAVAEELIFFLSRIFFLYKSSFFKSSVVSEYDYYVSQPFPPNIVPQQTEPQDRLCPLKRMKESSLKHAPYLSPLPLWHML